MRSARQSAIRLLQLMMVACVVLPAVLFAFAAWLNYRHEHAVADERIERSLDILHEHTLKVFQTVERTIAEVEEITRDLSDDEIRKDQARLHERLRRIVEALPQLRAIFVIDRQGRPIASSQLAQLPPDFNVRERSFFSAHAAGDSETYVSDVLMPRLTAFGTPFFVLSRARPSPDGGFNGVIAVAVLPRYFEEFYALIGGSPGSLYALVRNDGTFLARYPVLEDRGRTIGAGSHLRQAITEGRERALYTTPQSEVDGVARRVGYRRLEGFPVYVVAGLDSSAIRDEWLTTMGGHLIFGLPATLLLLTIIGIAMRRTRRLHAEAERREAAEAALRQSQRLEAIGQLTGGVAHDFNNLLMIVSGSVQRLRRDLTSEKHSRLLDMITNATTRGESLTRQLLAFSRRQMLSPVVIDLGDWLPELKDMLSRSLRGDIAIEVAVKGDCAVKVDPSELELALLNLAVNARDAMPNGGSLTITAEPVLVGGKASAEGLRGEFVAVHVADTGAGIATDVLPRVFEPFFTTKEVGKGTGLGLSQVYGFARQSGGTATVESSVGRGTVITLYLPRTRERPATARAPAEAESAPQLAGTALLVEDNPEVAEVARAYFQQLGYRVRLAANARDALDLLGREPDVDIVFSDVLMPGGMNGVELGQAVRRLYPGMPVLLATGYSDSVRDAVQQGFTVLQKPFDLAGLEQALRGAQRSQGRHKPAPSAVS
ncbi:MAG TPA: ATP-binding protein [Xanthobacteraceae bacterium]|jgi:two-component system NtrC family sensor kinase